MKLAVVGSRSIKENIKNNEFIFKKLDEIHQQYNVELLISGGAPGVDTIGEKWADSRKIPKDIKRPKWTEPTPGVKMKQNSRGEWYNPIAGILRNTLIVDECTHLVAFWDGKSTGTDDSVTKSKKQKKLLDVIIVKLDK